MTIRREATRVVIQSNGVDGCIVKETGVLAAGAAGVSGLDCVTVGQAAGLGQTWQTVTRISGTPYTNSTGKLIFFTGVLGASSSLTVVVGGYTIWQSTVSTAVSVFQVPMIPIPAGATYTITWTGTFIGIGELR